MVKFPDDAKIDQKTYNVSNVKNSIGMYMTQADPTVHSGPSNYLILTSEMKNPADLRFGGLV